MNSPISGRQLGWYNQGRNGKIGDLALSDTSQGGLIGNGGDLSQTFSRVNGYAVQKEWSNIDGQYEVAPRPQPAPPPVPDLFKFLFG